MARPISGLESHPQRYKIIEAIASGRPLAEVASWTDPPVHRAALSRFKSRALAEFSTRVDAARVAIANSDNDLGGAVQGAVQKVALAIAVDPFLSHVKASAERRERWIQLAENAEKGPDHRALAAHDGNDLRALELHARLAGRLESGSQISVQVVMPAAPRDSGADSFDGLTLDIKPDR